MNKKDAMKEVMDLIDEKAKRRREQRENTQQDATHVQEVLKFLNNLDLLTSEAQNEIDFYVGMERECNMLKQRLKSFDPYIRALVEWNDTKEWQKLYPIGVRLYWSKYYKKLNPDCDEEEYIDVGRLLIDDCE